MYRAEKGTLKLDLPYINELFQNGKVTVSSDHRLKLHVDFDTEETLEKSKLNIKSPNEQELIGVLFHRRQRPFTVDVYFEGLDEDSERPHSTLTVDVHTVTATGWFIGSEQKVRSLCSTDVLLTIGNVVIARLPHSCSLTSGARTSISGTNLLVIKELRKCCRQKDLNTGCTILGYYKADLLRKIFGRKFSEELYICAEKELPSRLVCDDPDCREHYSLGRQFNMSGLGTFNFNDCSVPWNFTTEHDEKHVVERVGGWKCNTDHETPSMIFSTAYDDCCILMEDIYLVVSSALRDNVY